MVLLVSIVLVVFSLAFVAFFFINGRIAIDGPIVENKQQELTDELQRNNDEIDTLKSSIKDLELEFAIGRIDKPTFEVLRKEYLQKWLLIEKKVQKQNDELKTDVSVQINEVSSNVKNNFCPQCGVKISNPQSDRFCANCGVKLT